RAIVWPQYPHLIYTEAACKFFIRATFACLFYLTFNIYTCKIVPKANSQNYRLQANKELTRET
ncbi:MAG TPA: hypothetical protein VEG61_05840, partial [Candidatus Dormibacteraeota bacterium]|nr:hypothetical protein [Candidatus Dormibacteraeota bacterium]